MNPRLRPNLRFIQQVQDGAPIHIVKDPVTLKYFRFGSNEAALMQLMDGSRSPAQLAAAADEKLGIATSPSAIERFVQTLKGMGLVERTQEERSALLTEFVHRSRKTRARGDGATVLRMRFSLGDPDVLLGRMDRAFGFFFTPGFIIGSAILFAAYVLIVTMHWSAFTAGLAEMYTPSRYTLGFVVMLYVTTVMVFLIHEFGHGLTCKHFGGEVHELGLMLVYFMPAFYCNVNDAWMFEKRSHRLWVTFAGGWIQAVIAALAALVWVLTQGGTFVNDVAFVTLLIGGGLAVLVNFNPLIPLDGYYALVDWVGIPNLRARSFEYLRARANRLVTRDRTPLPRATAREARIFLIYGTLSFLYITIILSLIGFGLAHWLTGKWGWWGFALFAFLFWRVTPRLRYKLAAAIRRAYDSGFAKRTAPLLRQRRTVAFALMMSLFLLLPWTVRVSAPAHAESLQYDVVTAGEPARVERVFVREGDSVSPGQPLAQLRSRALEIEWSRTRAAIHVLERELSAARLRQDDGAARATELELSTRNRMLERLTARRDALLLRAPFAARVVTAHPDALAGMAAEPGDTLLELESAGALRARVSLAERDVAHLAEGDVVRIKFPVRPSVTWKTRVAKVAPAATQGHVDVLVPLTTADDRAPLMAGMVGTARIAVHRTNVAAALIRSLRRVIRTDLIL